MIEKIKEFVSELEIEIKRCEELMRQNTNDGAFVVCGMTRARMLTLIEVKNNLEDMLDEIELSK